MRLMASRMLGIVIAGLHEFARVGLHFESGTWPPWTMMDDTPVLRLSAASTRVGHFPELVLRELSEVRL